MRKLIIVLLFSPLALMAQTSIFNCSTFSNTGTCNVTFGNSTGFWSSATNLPSGSGPLELIAPSDAHKGGVVIWNAKVNVQAFTTTITFIPDTVNFALVFQNSNNNSGFDGNRFNGGAGCEGGFYQAFAGNMYNFVFALQLDQQNYLSGTGPFAYSNTQVYGTAQPPCNPNDANTHWYITNKNSTSPVPLNSPTNSANTCVETVGGTCDTYSVTVDYDGTNLNECFYDVTLANGSCSSGTSGTGTFFQKTWTAVNLPSIVGGNTAWVGLASSTNNSGPGFPLFVNNWSYTVNSPPANQSISTYTTGSAARGTSIAANPTFSPAAGSYGSTQNVTISSSTANSYICYTLSSTFPTFLPQTDQLGGCAEGTLYTGAVSVPTTQTLYAMAGTLWTVASPTMPSNLVTGLFTIGGSPATAPTCTPTSGTSTSPITVTCTNSNSGTTIMCYTKNSGTPATNGSGTGCTTGTALTGASNTITISTTTSTLNIIAGTSALSDSTVNTYGTYTINGPGAPTITGARLSGGTLH